MAVLRFLWKKSFPLDWQPYNVYAINRDRDDFRPELVLSKQTMDRYRRIVGLSETNALEYYVSKGAPLRLFFRPTILACISFFVFPMLSDQLLEEISYRWEELFLRQEHIVRHEDSWVNFNRSLRVVNFPCSRDWLSYERTQLKIRVEFISTGFSNNCLRLKETRSLWLKWHLFDCPPIWTVAKKQTMIIEYSNKHK